MLCFQKDTNLQNNCCAEICHQSALLISNSMLHCRVVFGWTLLTNVNSWIKDCLLWLRLPWRLRDMNLKCSKSLLLTTTIKLDYVSFLNTPWPPFKISGQTNFFGQESRLTFFVIVRPTMIHNVKSSFRSQQTFMQISHLTWISFLTRKNWKHTKVKVRIVCANM